MVHAQGDMMPSIRDLFPERWLKAHHLGSHTPVVAIESVMVEQLYNPRARRAAPKLVVRFHGKQKALPLNKTQALALAGAVGSEDYDTWVGHVVRLSAGVAPSGAPTIVITTADEKPSWRLEEVDDDPEEVMWRRDDLPEDDDDDEVE